MNNLKRKKFAFVLTGFSIIELIIVIIILSMTALMVIPAMSTAADRQIDAATVRIAVDMEYARNMAVTNQKNYWVTFISAQSYKICDSSGTINHPVKGGLYIVDFTQDSRMSQVTVDADFDPGSDKSITFDYLGSPYSGMATSNALNSGHVDLQAGSFTSSVTIEPVTGYVSIQ